jgi:hypothetical protein
MAAGFIEYRLPTFATALGLRLVQDPNLSSWSPADGRAGPASRRDRFLNGHRHSILLPQIVAELVRSDGVRVFHPYHGLFPVDARWGLRTPVWGMYQSARAGKKALSARVAKLRR